MLRRAIGYYRVSTDPQAATGFSLEGQRNAVHRYISDERMDLVAEYTEAETAFRSSKITLEKRPHLREALRHFQRCKATLVIAALDRLARNVVFIATLIETRIEFVALDIPNARPFMIHIYAAIAEEESRQKGYLVRAAIALAKANGRRCVTRGEVNGRQSFARAEAHRHVVEEIRKLGIRGACRVAKELNRRCIPYVADKPWPTMVVQRMLQHLGCYERAPIPWTKQWKIEAKARAETVRSVVLELRHRRVRSYKAVAAELNARDLRTARGGLWKSSIVSCLKQHHFPAGWD
jgi:DNA invertase Pin-like site-specific DNA recombinase